MIIKEINIKNFLCYYGDKNKFCFSEGLTLILGENGDGKTKFFEALQWLLNTVETKGNVQLLSEMCKSSMSIGDVAEVAVSMLFEHDGEKSVEKSFTVEKTDNGFRASTLTFRGFETEGVERVQVNGKNLIDRCYDAFIQRFSMFKGESELDVFNDATALKDLVDKFSDIRKFEDIVNYTTYFEDNANKAYMKEMRSDNKVAKEAAELEHRIQDLSDKLFIKRKEIKDKEDSLNICESRLSDLAKSKENSERYKDVQSRLKKQEERKHTLKGQISSVNYNHALLDKLWILCAFPPLLQEFKQKSSNLSHEKRRLDKDFERQKNIKIGKIEAVKEMQGALANGSPELPWYLPNQETMEEMLRDRVCKVCGREIQEGDDAYMFMTHKLEEYKRHISQETQKQKLKAEIEDEELFSNTYIEELHNLSMSLSGPNESFVFGKTKEIEDRMELVHHLLNELKEVEQKIQDAIDEKTRIIIQSNVSEAALEKDFEDIKGLFELKERDNTRLAVLHKEKEYLEEQLNKAKQQMNELTPNSSLVKVYKRIHLVLEAIANACARAKKANLRRFLSNLEDKANRYLESLSANDFHGEIHLIQTANESAQICLNSSSGEIVTNPSGSQETLMYMSVLFAISDFTQEKRDEDYPLIFDAATSSFGDRKEENFYNVIDRINKQCIILTKDFLEKGKIKMHDIEKLTCSVYRIKKADGFDANNLSSVRTTIEKIR